MSLLSKSPKNCVIALQQNLETTADLFAALNQMHDVTMHIQGRHYRNASNHCVTFTSNTSLTLFWNTWYAFFLLKIRLKTFHTFPSTQARLSGISTGPTAAVLSFTRHAICRRYWIAPERKCSLTPRTSIWPRTRWTWCWRRLRRWPALTQCRGQNSELSTNNWLSNEPIKNAWGKKRKKKQVAGEFSSI